MSASTLRQLKETEAHPAAINYIYDEGKKKKNQGKNLLKNCKITSAITVCGA